MPRFTFRASRLDCCRNAAPVNRDRNSFRGTLDQAQPIETPCYPNGGVLLTHRFQACPDSIDHGSRRRSTGREANDFDAGKPLRL